ncbi:hypothetical protein LPB140_05765 [Sphingorhabdus lutea]|uniref:Uncharacterized protein n=1 Tax=Sphingorhabdus lutea TaxID=1913578 RepID=A0A1L3JB75_9SPHN|nr:hypothetical protein LPB140_05765 [Sphingorhabdus lutea]
MQISINAAHNGHNLTVLYIHPKHPLILQFAAHINNLQIISRNPARKYLKYAVIICIMGGEYIQSKQTQKLCVRFSIFF